MSVPLTRARDAEPRVTLAYSPAIHNGVFGSGFDIDVPAFALRTDAGVPQYAGSDQVLAPDGSQLVPACQQRSGRWSRVEQAKSLDGADYTVTRYRPRVESGFDLVERWENASTLEVFWSVTDTAGRMSFFGRTAAARVADPVDPRRVYRWLIEQSTDAHGNVSRFHYKCDDIANIASHLLCEQGRGLDCQRYLSRIEYGNWNDAKTGEQAFSFQVLFDYGEYDVDAGSAVPVGDWAYRPDPFSTFRAGFEIRTKRRCSNILMVHQFPDACP